MNFFLKRIILFRCGRAFKGQPRLQIFVDDPRWVYKVVGNFSTQRPESYYHR